MLRSVHAKRASHSAATALAACLIALSTSAIDAETAAASGCAGAGAPAASASPGKLRSALLCVVNRKRSPNALRSLKFDRKLQKAATRHARDMLRHDYFAHQRPGGPDLTERLHRAGWHGHAWGETI